MKGRMKLKSEAYFDDLLFSGSFFVTFLRSLSRCGTWGMRGLQLNICSQLRLSLGLFCICPSDRQWLEKGSTDGKHMTYLHTQNCRSCFYLTFNLPFIVFYLFTELMKKSFYCDSLNLTTCCAFTHWGKQKSLKVAHEQKQRGLNNNLKSSDLKLMWHWCLGICSNKFPSF